MNEKNPSLDNNIHIVPPDDKVKNELQNSGFGWDRKRNRAYHRILSGLKKANYNNKRIRFLTLTTSNIVHYPDLKNDFQVLVKRIRRKYGDFEFFRVKTSEGFGVIHLVYWGCFIPQKWLSYTWLDIHNSPIVDIREIDNKLKNVARYIVSQHIAGQEKLIRSSWSWHWVYPRFVRDWKNILNKYVRSKGIVYCVNLWDRWLMGSLMPDDRHIIIRMRKQKPKKWLDNRFWWCGQ